MPLEMEQDAVGTLPPHHFRYIMRPTEHHRVILQGKKLLNKSKVIRIWPSNDKSMLLAFPEDLGSQVKRHLWHKAASSPLIGLDKKETGYDLT